MGIIVSIMEKQTITFIGGGNMARCLIGGLLETGVDAGHIRVADIEPEPLAAGMYPVQRFTDNAEAIQGADVVVLAVKPQILREVAQELSPHLRKTTQAPLFISIAAGIRMAHLYAWLGGSPLPVVRVMPNTPALVRCGASALFAGEHVSVQQRELAENILRAVGLTMWMEEESLMDAVTALSGSGPAYFFLVMEALEKAGTQLGLTANEARLLTLQTAFGAAKMALESQDDAATLRARVTSKGGTTEQALRILQDSGLETIFRQALEAAHRRSLELAQELGDPS